MDYFNKVKANAETLWGKYMALPSIGLKIAVAFTALVGVYVAASVLPILLWIAVTIAAFYIFTPHKD